MNGKNSNLSELGGKLTNIFAHVTASIPTTQIAAGGYKQISLSCTVPSGYKAIGCSAWHLSGSVFITMMACTTTTVILGNTSSNTATVTGNVTLLLAKSI